MRKIIVWSLILIVAILPACGSLTPNPERVAEYQQAGAPLRDAVQRNIAAGDSAQSTIVNVLSALGLLGASIGGSVATVRAVRGPADKGGKLQAAAKRAAEGRVV